MQNGDMINILHPKYLKRNPISIFEVKNVVNNILMQTFIIIRCKK